MRTPGGGCVLANGETARQIDRGCRLQPVPDRDRPAPARDCLNCGLTDGMKLQNVLGTNPTNIPLLYICSACGTLLTIPPPRSPVAF